MKLLIVTALLIGMTGCANGNRRLSQDPFPPSAIQAEAYLIEGELYQARRMTRALLEKNPNDPEAQLLMAKVIDQEIAREQTLLDGHPEELADPDKTNEARTWLERSESLFKIGYYEQALLAAEKVFLYDADNHRASELIDDIKGASIEEGRGNILAQTKVRQEEIRERIMSYRRQAESWIEAGQWGAARLAVEKILLLAPEDPDGLKLQAKIRQHRNQRDL